MNDPEELILKTLVTEALENCHDTELLDLIYKLLICDSPTK